MSDEKKSSNNKIASLLEKAKNRKKPGSQYEAQDAPSEQIEDLHLDVEDVTREQETPPELTETVDEEELILDENGEGTKRPGLMSRLNMKQRVLLAGVIVIVFVGAQKTLSNKKSLDYLDQSPTDVASATAESPNELSSEPLMDDGFEPIDQGEIAPDTNTVNLTIDPGENNAAASNAFGSDPFGDVDDPIGTLDDPQTPPADTSVQEGVTDQPDPSPVFEDAGETFSTPAIDEGPLNEDASLPPQDFVESRQPSTEIRQVQSEIAKLNSEVSAISQSVVSIRQEMSSSSATNRELLTQVSKLMAALKERDAQVRQMKSRPDIDDLVIFRAASNCSTCVPHALFTWNGKDVEVGDGLEWQGYEVAIRGDRMTLRNEQDVYHYWYR